MDPRCCLSMVVTYNWVWQNLCRLDIFDFIKKVKPILILSKNKNNYFFCFTITITKQGIDSKNSTPFLMSSNYKLMFIKQSIWFRAKVPRMSKKSRGKKVEEKLGHKINLSLSSLFPFLLISQQIQKALRGCIRLDKSDKEKILGLPLSLFCFFTF